MSRLVTGLLAAWIGCSISEAQVVTPPWLVDEPCGGGLIAPPGGAAELPPAALRIGSQVDVLVAWTPNAESIIGGGTQAAVAWVRNYALATNSYYAASGINERIRLVLAVRTEYTESGTYLDNLFRLQDPNDGFMDELHVLRDVAGADLVALISNVTDVCGVAWLFGDDPAYGFSMTSVYCSSLTFAHELGHNFGCCHDRDNSGGGCFTPAAYGYRYYGNSGTQWRTIMAYAPGTRIGYFSNPNISFDGQPTGTATENNAATFPLTHPSIAAYRAETNFVDCDHNLIADAIDIAAGAAPDVNHDGWIDTCPLPCPGDLNGDLVVDLADVSQLLANYGQTGPNIPGDLDHSGAVDLGDLAQQLANYGVCD